jgi:phage terminase Nu1 subunit (DNA packaging protein)
MSVQQTFPAEAIAKLFDCTPNYVWWLQKRGIITRVIGPDGEPLKGRYDLTPTVRAYIRYLKNAAELDSVGESELAQAKLMRLRAQGEAEVLRLKVLRGELHRAEDVEAVMNDLLSGIKMRLLAIPSRVARLLVGQSQIAKVVDILTGALESALGDVLNYRPEDFHARNKQYLLANELTLESLLGVEPATAAPAVPEKSNGNGQDEPIPDQD